MQLLRQGAKVIISGLGSALLVASGEPLFLLSGHRINRGGNSLASAKSILVVRPDEIGDVVMTSAFLRELRGNAPEAWITLVTRPLTHNLVENCPYVNEVLEYEFRAPAGGAPPRYLSSLPFARLHLLKRHYDLAILPRPHSDRQHAAFLMYLSGARRRIALSEALKLEGSNCSSALLFTAVLPASGVSHDVARTLELIEELGGSVKSRNTELWLTDEDESFARQMRERLKDRAVLIAIAPCGGNSTLKQWPLTKWTELTNWLSSKYNAGIIIVGDYADQSLAEQIRQATEQACIDLSGRATLRQSAAAIKQCRLFIGSDSGPMHMAAAVGVPAIALFGSTCTHRYAPWGAGHSVVSLDLICSPCHREDHGSVCRKCLFPEPYCMNDIGVETVKEEVTIKLGEFETSR